MTGGFEFVSDRETKEKGIVKQKNFDEGITGIAEKSDTAETIRELNDDSVNKDNFSNMDMKAIIHPVEMSAILAFDSLIVLGFLPSKSSYITRAKKRLSPSLNGKGREQIVQIAQGIDAKKQGTSIWDKMGNWFKPSGGV